MEEASFGSLFGDVDLSDDPHALREYLDRVRGITAVRAAKVESIELAELRPGRRVLDVGCGPGDDARQIAELVGPTGLVVGVDKSEILVTAARRATPSGLRCLDFICADATSLPLPSDSFDACRVDRTIQHVSAADAALRELARVTRPGGVIVVSEMLNVLDLTVEERRELLPAVLSGLWSRDERRGWIGFLLPPLLERAGFTDIEVHRRRERLTSFGDASLILQLPQLCERAVEHGAVTTADARAWLSDLEGDFREGRAGLQSEFLHARARKPAAPASRITITP